MKPYLVFMTDLALAPLEGKEQRGGKLAEFDDLKAANELALEQKYEWDRVIIYERKDDELKIIQHYLHGFKYDKK